MKTPSHTRLTYLIQQLPTCTIFFLILFIDWNVLVIRLALLLFVSTFYLKYTSCGFRPGFTRFTRESKLYSLDAEDEIIKIGIERGRRLSSDGWRFE
ncbi:unnamed protein product [Cochlearia groenlandica]